ncbi:MAG TPA: sulfurtransferase TusA family protein [Chloroflexota bacterium]|nr:sulfurtransferase TusA family protein [Chloroflexota bacterium]
MLPPGSEAPPAQTYDARGQPCPLPLLRLARALRALRPGEVIALLADDPAAREDVATWIRRSGHALLAWHQAADHDVYYVRKRLS